MMLLTEHHGCLDIKFKQLINQQNKADNQQRLSVSWIERQFQKSIKRNAVLITVLFHFCFNALCGVRYCQ